MNPSTLQRPDAARSDAPTSYSPSLALRLCELSSAVYAPGADCGNAIIESDATDTRVLVCEQNDALVFAFRGTRDLRNWLTDLDCLQTGYPMLDWGACRVHLGFWRAWTSIREPLWDWVKARGDALPSRIYFTGHSLGGALAMLAAHRFELEFGGTPTTCTFGQPRVGNAYFAQLFNFHLGAHTWRVVHADDIVPRVPWCLGGYQHAGQEVFYGLSAGSSCLNAQISAARQRGPTGRGYLLNPTTLEKIRWDLRNAARELCQGKIALLDDHHVNTYLGLFR